MISANTRNLIQAISIDGNVVDRYFAVASEAPRNTVEARISAMPRNGRSARAGAVRLAGHLVGQGQWGTVQPGGCGGRRGHGKLGGNCKLSNRVRGQKTIIAQRRQGLKTGSRYALRSARRL